VATSNGIKPVGTVPSPPPTLSIRGTPVMLVVDPSEKCRMTGLGTSQSVSFPVKQTVPKGTAPRM
jgi:hypothetical protein